ncbi:MAG: CHRD domain-containing protein [Pseudomonadota bacterium]
MKFTHTATVFALILSAGAGHAATLQFAATLTGAQEVPAIVTDAVGEALITVDTTRETLSVDLSVMGISLMDLSDALVALPVGPIHLHNAPAGSNGPIVVPFPFDGLTYSDTLDGFDLMVEDVSYANAAALAGSSVGFDDFLALMSGSEVYFNVHTDAFPGGKLRGQVAPVPVPAAGGLLLGAVLAGVAVRRRRTRV